MEFGILLSLHGESLDTQLLLSCFMLCSRPYLDYPISTSSWNIHNFANNQDQRNTRNVNPIIDL